MFLSSFLLFLLFTTTFNGVFGKRRMLDLDVDAVCKTEPDNWTCKSRYNCTTLTKALQKGIRPDLCTFLGNVAIFCCPTEKYLSSIGTISDSQPTVPPQKPVDNYRESREPSSLSVESKANNICKEYSEYVYRTVLWTQNIPEKKTKNITLNDCSIQPLIIGGTDAKPKEFPHMVLVGYKETQLKNITWICGGSLISPKFILTAAHCIINSSFKYWVRLGELDLSTEKDDSKPLDIQVVKQIIHPQYNNQLLYHDIALFELELEVEFSTYIRPICLHTGNQIESNKAVASGWGHTRWGGRRSARLQKVTLPPVSNQICNQTYSKNHKDVLPRGIVDDLMVCAGGLVGKDSCQGDSGGPLQIIHENLFCMYSIIGVVSYGKGCALGYPGIYTKISNYVPWIVKIVWS